MTIEEQSDVLDLALRLNSLSTLCRLMVDHLHEGSQANLAEGADVFSIVHHALDSTADKLSILAAGK